MTHRTLLATGILAILVSIGGAYACSTGSTEEDRQRTEILAADPMLKLDIPGIKPTGPATTEPGGGPNLTAGEASRDYTSELPPADLVEPLTAAAKATGWEILSSRTRDDREFISGTRNDEGFGASLGIHISPQGSGSEVSIILETNAAEMDR